MTKNLNKLHAQLNNVVNEILTTELNEDITKQSDKMICEIHPEINFKYNSFNVCIGKQGTGKTTSVLKELIKLSLLNDNSEKEDMNLDKYHLIIYVSNNSSDATFNSLYKHISIPIVKTDYENVDKQIENLIKLKDTYNSIKDGKMPISELGQNGVDELLKSLYVSDFSRSRLHTFILLDDSAFLLRNENSKWNKWLCQLRHLNFTVFMCLQIWKSINTSIKSQISTIHLFRGFSRQQVNYIYQQISLDMDFYDLWKLYLSIPKNKKIIIDLIDGTVKID
jgi:hypothetical protein